MRHPFIILFLTICTTVYAQMKAEADSFLKALPQNQPADWTEAIDLAIEGCSHRLDSVRNSRNGAPRLPENITADPIAQGIMIFKTASDNNARRPMLIYLHGGGWTVGSINSCARFCAELAASGKVIVAALDYPLAPEHPFPAAIEFITDAIDSLVRTAAELGSSPELISIGGDSSGGNLAISAASLRPEAIRSMVLFYPVTDSDTGKSNSWKSFASLPSLNGILMDAFNRAYRSDCMKTDPLISPLKMTDNTIATLPETLIINAGRDILCDQGTAFAERLLNNGVTVRHTVFPDAVHLFITVPGQPTAFSHAVKQTLDFLDISKRQTK